MRRVPLRARDGSLRAYALVDDEDFAAVSQWRWHLTGAGYVARKEDKHRVILLHRWLLNLAPGDPRMGEHENRNPLDNRRSNLRVAAGQRDNKQNLSLYCSNRSGHRGVSWSVQRRKWRARVTLHGREHHVGFFESADEAGMAASRARARLMPFSEDAP